MSQSLELICLYNLQEGISPTSLLIKHSNELIAHTTHHRNRVIEAL